MSEAGDSLQARLNKATSPASTQEDWEDVMGFCDQVNKEPDGPQISVKLLVHKIQSRQEWEALQALTVLEACMKNCGRRFHTEVGKFRFLNELVKVISPKYLGDQVSERVKTKVIRMLYSWTVSLPDEAKISEAYHMLKSQGVVSADPEIHLDATLIPSPSPRPANPVFDDEKKSKRLTELLKSKKPEDLKEANRLIKNMVKEDEVRTQKSTKQKDTLETANNSVKLITEMLAHFSPEGSAEGDKELLKELYDDCAKLRQTVIQLATESEDNDSSLGDILQASDDLSHAINSYKKIVDGQMINGEAEREQQKQAPLTKGINSAQNSDFLIDLVDVEVQSASESQHQPPAAAASLPGDLWGLAAPDPPLSSHAASSAPLSLLDEELLCLGFNEPAPAACTSAYINQNNHIPFSQAVSSHHHNGTLLDISPSSVPACPSPSLFPDVLSASPVSSTPTPPAATTVPWPGLSTPQHPDGPALATALPPALTPPVSQASPAPADTPVPPPQVFSPPGISHTPLASLNQSVQDLALLDLGSSTAHSIPTPSISLPGDIQAVSRVPPAWRHADDFTLLHPTTSILPPTPPPSVWGQEASLSDVFVPLSAIKISQMCPVMECDKNGIRFLLHFATDCPPGRPDVLVMVASILSTAPLPARDVLLQAAVPKTMKVRLQQPSGRELAPFNPLHPPAAITQIMLLSNPLKEKVRLRYKLSFTLGTQSHTEVGEVNGLPPTDPLEALQNSWISVHFPQS